MLRARIVGVALAGALAVSAGEPGPFLERYCIQCHGPDVRMADRSFESLDADLTDPDTLHLWREILDRLNLGTMPPEGAGQPSDQERQAVIDTMTVLVRDASTAAESQGRKTPLRRLNRYEYDRTVRDLLSLQDLLADPTEGFPPDAADHGFDNIGAALQTTDFLLSAYLEAAERFVDAAVAPAERPEVRTRSFRAQFHPTRNRHDGQDVPGLYQNIRKNTSDQGGFLWLDDFLEGVPHSGYYRLRFRAEAVNREYPYDERIVGVRKEDPLRVAVVAGSARYGELEFRTTSDRVVAEFDLADETDWYEARVWLDEGYQPRLTFPNGPNGVKPLRKSLVTKYAATFPEFIRGYVVQEGPINAETIASSFSRRVSKEGASTTELTTAGTSRSFNRRDGWSTFFREYQGPRVRVYEIELEGPLHDTWPPPSHVALFGDFEPILKNAEPILERFASKAFRRPAVPSEIGPLTDLVRARAERGDSELDALKAGLRAVLASPGFLYLREGDGPLDQYALASRLSYFLWSSMPDRELLATDLRAPRALRESAERLLSDPKADAFARRFTARWLELYKIGTMPPSPRQFQQYYVDGLETAMQEEVRLFFQHLLEHNEPVARFIDADYTFVNGGLARLYGFDGIRGSRFRRVALEDSRRGGLLGMAAVLTASANGIDTSPVVRGVWVLENILGTPPPPPPPDVEPLEPDIRGMRTIRDQLAAHRKIPTCNACHQRIDPLGFALENFDPIGGWRERYPRVSGPSPRVDSSGTLPGGESFDGIVGLKRILSERHGDRFARNLTAKLLTYATGRVVGPADEQAIEAIVGSLHRKGGGLRDLVLLVVESEPFAVD